MKRILIAFLLIAFIFTNIAVAAVGDLNPGMNGKVISINYGTYTSARALSASSAESITVPTGANYVLLSGTADFYVKWDGTATVPTDTDNGIASELNPGMRQITGLTSISVISASTCIVTAVFYK
jgi:hypothetical protein